ncbi:DNA cytosine methyltransferase [Desulfitobacterium sp.]|uniref:DNA cytosine methyltransferase n=1 Tax=Desulfitobacterium sp. TaxID=49981 RepID=UPI002CF11A24|nr:DNA cytosine methyltransferase [Desulfitobacterium sp.]HVJ49399.1 DNA cytosine methyltransferase [Desulfitobacterium sp.]
MDSLNKVKKTYEFKDLHLFCGSGGGRLGFRRADVKLAGLQGNFRNLCGIDVDPRACENYEYLTGDKAVCMDLFERRDYIAFHGQEPDETWRDATPEDIRKAANYEYPDLIFLSPPCKGFSGLLPQKTFETDKYQALNRLTVRGIFLALEAFKDDFPSFIFLENVPRIMSRGKKLLHTIMGMLEDYGYAVNGLPHDCGEIAGLGQHRKRYLLVARNLSKVSTFLYQPPKQRVKAIGEILNKVPMPDAPSAGPMHKLPRLQWKTWVRLALISAGGDWRDLKKIAPKEYRLEHIPRGGGSHGVQDWNRPSHTVTGNAKVNGSTAACIADPRLNLKNMYPSGYGVQAWNKASQTIRSAGRVIV